MIASRPIRAVAGALPLYFDREERRLVFQSVVVGVVVWCAAFSLRSAVQLVFGWMIGWLETGPSLWLLMLPLAAGAVARTFIVRMRPTTIFFRDASGKVRPLVDVEGDGLERAIALYHASEPSLEKTLLGPVGLDARWEMPTISLALRKWVATFFTLATGGSGGLTASATLIGESVAAGLFKPRRLNPRVDPHVGRLQRLWHWWRSADPDHLQTAQLCGIAAAVSTLFGAPFAGAFFASEVMYRKRPVIEKLLYSIISALVAFFLTSFFTSHVTLFEVETRIVPPAHMRYYAVIIMMAAAIAAVSLLFGRLRNQLERLFLRRLPSLVPRHLAGALLTGALAIVTLASLTMLEEQGLIPVASISHNLRLILGPGEVPINAVLAGEFLGSVALIALAAKLLATLLTIGSGGSAGLLVPAVYLGVMVAAAMAPAFGYAPMVLAVPAVTASLVSVVNVPIAAILVVVELFGASYMVPSLIALLVSFILAHQNTIYRTQRDTQAGQQIMPGFGVRRLPVPASWNGRSLVELNVRHDFEVTVIGVLERHSRPDEPSVRRSITFDPDPDEALHAGDVLIVLGSEEHLDHFWTTVYEPGRPAGDTTL